MKNLSDRPAEIIEIKDSQTGLTGWIAIHTSVNGLSFGGCRIAKSVTKEIVAELAHCMTYKLALHGLPMGGAKGGISFDPNAPDAVHALQRFGRQAAAVLKDRVVLGKDLGANDELMTAIYAGVGANQLLPIERKAQPNSIVPARLNQLSGYIGHMTGQGVAWATDAAIGSQLKNMRVVIQGFGAVGAGTAFRLAPYGVRVVGISDKNQCIYNPNGLPIEQMIKLNKDKEIPLNDLDKRDFESLPTDNLFELDADLLICAASSHCVHEQDIKKMRAKWISEGANFALTPPARLEAEARGITVIPDIIANSSSAAMVTMQMAAANQLNADVMWRNIKDNIFAAIKKSGEVAAKHGWTLRDAYMNEVAPTLLDMLQSGNFIKKAS